MKTLILSTALITILASLAPAQTGAPPVRTIGLPPAVSAGNEAADAAPRFDLKFPGGKVQDFVVAVSKALGKPVNVIIPKTAEATPIPAVEVSRVTVAALFRALGTASQSPAGGFAFRTEETNSPDAMWTFSVVHPPEIPTAKPATAPRAVRYFPVAEYLAHFSIEDITKAIESGWDLQGEATAPRAEMRFHEETKLLIVAGTTAQMELIPQVLAGLSQTRGNPRVESLPSAQKASQIILPKIEFKEASLDDAVGFIRRRAAELDLEKKGFNVVVNEAQGAPARTVTLSLSEVSALEALRLVAELSGVAIEVRPDVIVLTLRSVPPAP